MDDGGVDDRGPGGARGAARGHPWWQQRRSTAGRTAALAVVAVLLALAAVAVAASQVSEGRAPLSLLAATFWAPFAASCVAGAVAQRREAARR